jgi:DNA-binding beta-propeller fold protein YncE
MQWTTPLQPPGAIAGSTYTHIVLTSDGTQMIALDSTNALVSIFSPDNPAAGQSIVLRNPNVPNGPPANYNPQPWPDSVAITSTGKAWIDMSDWYPAEIDLSTMALQFRTDSGMGNGNNLFRMSADSTQFAVANVGNSGGTVFVWDPATDTFLMQGLQDYLSDLAISNSGQTIAAIAIDQLAPDDATYFLDPELHYINAPAYPDLGLPDSRASFGIQFSRQGSVYVLPRLDSIDFIDTAKGTLRARFLTPEPIITPQNVADIKSGALAMDTLGQTIFVISASGITVIQFPSPIDDLPQAVWPFSSPRRGTVATATQQRRLNLLKSHALTFSRPGSHRIQALKTEK